MPRKKKETAEPLVLNTEYNRACPMGQIQVHDSNPREGDGGAIYSSIETNGFYGAIVVQKSTNKILAGNHRYLAAQSLGATTIPAIFVDVDDAHALRIMLADNRTNDLSGYSNQLLAELLERVKIDETELGFQGTGWDEESYQALLADMTGPLFPEESEKQGAPELVVCPKCSHEFVAA